MKNKLNTMDSFEHEGFKITRDGKVIVLTNEEMANFRYLDTALCGRNCLECYPDDESDKNIIEKMMGSDEVCFNIETDILDVAYQDIVDIERDVVEEYINKAIRRSKDV